MGSKGFTPPPTLPTHDASLSDDAMDTDPPLSCPPGMALSWDELIGDGRGFTPPSSPPAGAAADNVDTVGNSAGNSGNKMPQEDPVPMSPQEVHLMSNTLKKGNVAFCTLKQH